MNDTNGFDINKVKDTALKVIQQPVAFYQGMPKTGGFVDPIIFLLVMGVVSGLIFGLLALFGGGRLAAAGLSAVIFMPIMMLIWSFISAAVLFVIWRLLGSSENYETAYRCFAFASAIFPPLALLSLLPYIGSVIAVLWGTYLMFIASQEVHKIDRQKALIAFGILAVIALIMNLSGEMASRHLESQMSEHKERSEKMLEHMEDMSPEEAGRAMGEFLRGLEEASQGK